MSILDALGVGLSGNLVSADQHNPHGYFESREIVDLNDRILTTLGLTWHSLGSVALDDGWLDHPHLVHAKRQLAQIIKRRESGQSATWGIKDPRICLLLPLYEEVFSSCGITPSYVLCLRDPRAVALSLARRDRFPPLFSELLWLDHTMRAIQLGRHRIRSVVHYEDWYVWGSRQLEALASDLRLAGTGRTESAEQILTRLVTSSLDHGEGQQGTFELTATEAIYTALKDGNVADALAVFKEVQRSIRLTAAHPAAGAQHRARSPAEITCQLFWRTSPEEPFCEINSSSVRTTLDSSPSVIRLPIPAGEPSVAGLRWDPANVPGSARIFSIRLKNACDELLWEWNGLISTLMACERYNMSLSEAAGEPGVLARFHNDDPSIVLPVSQEVNGISRTGGMLEVELALT